jgi:hypothetical protein
MNGQAPTGLQFDFLNDFVGMLLITVGIKKLSAFAIDPSFQTAMAFALVCSLLNCVKAFMGHFVFPTPVILALASNVLSLATLGAIVMFCTSMRRLSVAYDLNGSADNWTTTLVLVIILWVIPLGVLHFAGLGALLFGQPFHWDIGCFIIPVLCIFIVPLVYLFMSTSQMRFEAEIASDHRAA